MIHCGENLYNLTGVFVDKFPTFSDGGAPLNSGRVPRGTEQYGTINGPDFTHDALIDFLTKIFQDVSSGYGEIFLYIKWPLVFL